MNGPGLNTMLPRELPEIPLYMDRLVHDVPERGNKPTNKIGEIYAERGNDT